MPTGWSPGRPIAPASRSAASGRVLLGLGDPAGAESDRISAVWRLRDLARQEGLDPAFWRVGPGLLKVYADLGLTPLPLGRDGRIVQADETPDPSRRYLVCVAERDLERADADAAGTGGAAGGIAGRGVRDRDECPVRRGI